MVQIPSFIFIGILYYLSIGLGHNNYEESAWPNDILFVFPIVIAGTVICSIGLSVCSSLSFSLSANPFHAPLEIQPE